MIDWIMTFVFEHIKHIRHINLLGCIKKSQKEKWLGMLAQQRKDADYDFDHKAAMKEILETPADNVYVTRTSFHHTVNHHYSPPTCVCRKNCQSRTETRVYSARLQYNISPHGKNSTSSVLE
jgi:hypothetical protein